MYLITRSLQASLAGARARFRMVHIHSKALAKFFCIHRLFSIYYPLSSFNSKNPHGKFTHWNHRQHRRRQINVC